MARRLLLVIIAISMVPVAAPALEISEKNLPDEFPAGEEKLILNGAGLRTKWFMDIYAAGLYVKTKSKDPEKLVNADEPMAIKIIVIPSMLSKQKLVDSLLDGYEKFTDGNLAPIQERMDKFIGAHTGEIKPDDVYEYVYIPGKGTSVSKNGTLGITIEGLDYKKATFAIWLGKKPALESLKQGLLGN